MVYALSWSDELSVGWGFGFDARGALNVSITAAHHLLLSWIKALQK